MYKSIFKVVLFLINYKFKNIWIILIKFITITLLFKIIIYIFIIVSLLFLY